MKSPNALYTSSKAAASISLPHPHKPFPASSSSYYINRRCNTKPIPRWDVHFGGLEDG